MSNPIIVPLDVPDADAARRLLDALSPSVDQFKIGKQLFTAVGPRAVDLVHSYDKRVFLDLKYHDIPNTVQQAAASADGLGVWMLNVHVAGGSAMLRAAREGAGRRMLLIGVTVLTSLDDELWTEVHGDGALAIPEQVPRMANVAEAAGLDGVVASPREIASVRTACGDAFRIVTPGVRPAGSDHGDQRRAMTPGEAVSAGADYLVIGRPITQADDPSAAARAVLEEVERARSQRS
ncbi:orotidine-5'-phosphate decarboxylase [Candidatus Poribacteria bacterium]|jgi:orotidine-5'-phosphate decarboxylase|nr:orotidine-5'-phosphate decarboxylase [Candidatus Poribacteria bacterium]MBT5713761.1 orotidine-5'-phosphate decarboxylase [Candidatus Poribacteria bacterium]MBT7101430.1 orotidine-5'-phosphate decarboxylase [Candidatus Poribacteria bacterium]MBT7808760.1 orotidine-5'-phosphate decarboxylase [Candidatus Poribacteria bacterium]